MTCDPKINLLRHSVVRVMKESLQIPNG